MYIHDNELSLRNFRKEGLLSDADEGIVNGKPWYDVVLDAASENYLKYGINSIGCAVSDNNFKSCAVKLGEQICSDTGDPNVCQAVDVGKSLLSQSDINDNIPSVSAVSKDDLRNSLNEVLNIYKDIPCEQLGSEKREELLKILNDYEPRFVEAGMQSEFNSAIGRLTCDVVKEYKCNDSSLAKFESDPVCKSGFVKVWGKPIAIGGVSGAVAGVSWYKFVKKSFIQSSIAGVVTCGVVSYYLKNNAKE